MPPSEIRREAREALRGKWGKAILLLFAFSVFYFALGFIGPILGAISPALFFLLQIGILIFTLPFSFGFLISFIKLKRDEEVKAFGFIKDGFNHFGKSWGIWFHTFIRMLLPIICIALVMISLSVLIIAQNASSSLIDAAASAADNYKKQYQASSLYKFDSSLIDTKPSSSLIDAAISATDNYKKQDQSSLYKYDSTFSDYSTNYIDKQEKSTTNSSFIASPWFSILFVVLYIASLIYVFSRSLLYVLSFNICYDNPEFSSKECVKQSATLMKGNRGNYFLLILSFIGWAILSLFTFGIGMLWLFPYIQVASVCFYERVANIDELAVIEE